MQWWKAIYAAAMARGDAVCTTTPEFGPHMYAWVRAHAPGPKVSREDTLNNIWAINHWVAKQVSRLFTEMGGKAPTVVDDPEEGNWTLA